MTRLQVTEPAQQDCCEPAPHKVAQSVAGLAFNFSKVEVEPEKRPSESVKQEKVRRKR